MYIVNNSDENFPESKNLHNEKLLELINLVKTEVSTISEITEKIGFYFNPPKITKAILEGNFSIELLEKAKTIIQNNIKELYNPAEFIKKIKNESKENNIPIGKIFQLIRIKLTGNKQGIGILDLVNILEKKETEKRLI